MLASRGHTASRKSKRAAIPFILFTSTFRERETCKKPFDGKMCNSMGHAHSVMASCDNEAGNEFQTGSHRRGYTWVVTLGEQGSTGAEFIHKS